MIKRAVLLIAIVGYLCFGLWGYFKPVKAATSITWVKQNPIEPVHGIPVTVWVNFTASSGETPVLEYKINGISTNVNGAEDVPLGFDANWRFDIPAQVKGTTVNYQLLYRNADNSMGGITGFNWSYTVKVLDAIVDRYFDEDTGNFGVKSFNNIQSAVTSVDAGATITVNGDTYSSPNPILINKPVTILGKDTGNGIPLINAKIILGTQGTNTGLLKLFNLRFAEANGAITIGNVSNATFDQVELSDLTFGTSPVADSKAIQTASSVQIKNLSILNCEIYAAHGIDLNGDFGSAAIKFNNFYLTAQTTGSFDAIKINQDTKASASVNPLGTLVIQENTLNNPGAEANSYGSAILNQAVFGMTNSTDGKKLIASGNSFGNITDPTQFIQDKIADFVLVNVAPVAEGQSVTTAEETAALVTLNATDVNSDPMTFSIIKTPTHGTASVENDVVTYTPVADYYGPDSFTFKANDGMADSNTATVNITVTAVNDAPVTLGQSATTTEDTETSVILGATDVDNEALTFSIVKNPSHGSATLLGNIVTYAPTANYFGTDNFTYKANDGMADSITSTVTVTISAVNDAPTLTTIPAKEVNEGETLSFTAAAGDVDLPPQTFTFNLLNAPTGAGIDAGTGVFSWTPTEDQGPQNYSVKVCVSDGAVESPICQDVAVTVDEMNLPPALIEIPGQFVNEGELLTFTATGSDGDLPAQAFTYSFYGTAPNGMQIDAATGSVTWTPTEAQGPQGYTVKVCVSDGAVTTPTCQDVAVTVNEVNLPPALTAIPTKTVNEGELLTFTAVGSDSDLPKQIFAFSLVDAPSGASIVINTGVFTWTPTEEQGPQDYTVKVCVSDEAVETPVCQDVTITVNEVNLLPALTEIPSKTVNEGELLTFTAVGSDSDLPKQIFAFSLLDAPDGASIVINTGVFTWTPTEAQGGSSYTVSVCVSDGALNVCQNVAITVEKTDSAPIVGAIPEQTAREGELLTFTVPASDGDLPTQSLTFSMQDAPDGAVIDPSTGVFAWTPGEGQGPQDYTVKVCVSDSTLTTCQEVIIRISSLTPQHVIKIYLPLISR